MGAHRLRERFRRHLAVATVAGLFVAVFALPAWAANLTLDPSTAEPGETVQVHGNQFEALIVTIFFDDRPVASQIDLTRGGTFDTSFVVPAAAAPGTHSVTARSLLGVEAQAALIVPAPPTTTTTTAPTTTTTIPTTTTTVPTTTTTTVATTTTTTTAPTTATTGPPATTAPPATTTTGPTTTEPEEDTSTTSTVAESTTSSTTPPVSTDVTLPYTEGGWAFGAAPAADLPDMAGSMLTVGRFSISPGSGPAGSMVEFSLALDQALPGLDTLQLLIDGEPFGDPIEAAGGSVRAKRAIPQLAPGSYAVAIAHDEVTLATTTFEVTELLAAAAPDSGGRIWLVIPLVAIILALGWRTLAEVRTVLPPGSRLGPVAAWRVRRGRRPVN